jgi:8-oxo-dGTP diphosphatase
MADFKQDKYLVTTDAVVFTVLNSELKILLIVRKYPPFQGKYAIPGGFVKPNESLEEGVERELREETGVKGIFLDQIKAYGDVKRDPRGRVITAAFMALINGEKVKLSASTDAELAKWRSINDLPELAFDHKQIIKDALAKLRHNIENTAVAYQIMPEKFTLTDLQTTYEAVLEKKLDKRNFRKKMRELNVLKELSETRMIGAHRPARLYSFKSKLKN